MKTVAIGSTIIALVKGGKDTTDGFDNGENGQIIIDGADVTPPDGDKP